MQITLDMEGFTMNETTKKTDREALLDRLMDMLPQMSTKNLRKAYRYLIHAMPKKDGDKGDT